MLAADLRDLLCALRDSEARFLVVGGYAVGVHGRPRATKDLDVWIDASRANAPRVMQALTTFGAPLFGLTVKDFETPGIVLQIGVPPNRIDVLTKISGASFKKAWPRRIQAPFGPDLVCPVIGFADLLANKRASGRPQDLADVAALEGISRRHLAREAQAQPPLPRVSEAKRSRAKRRSKP